MRVQQKRPRIFRSRSAYGDGRIVRHDSLLFGRIQVRKELVPVFNTNGELGVRLEPVEYLEPCREMVRSRSRYIPHQGVKECARRRAA